MNNPSPSDRSRNPAETSALAEFELDPDRLHLNHGSYGAVPRSVRAEQDLWRATIERDPTKFFTDDLPLALRRMAGHVAQRFGGRDDDWVFCENATAAVNSVLHSLELGRGDEILTTSHAYGAVLKAMSFVAARRGAHLKEAALPTIIESEDEILESIEQAFTPQTRLLIVDHITSATATIFPAQRIAVLARSRGIPILIDGAHAPGHITLDVPSLGADWYTGNAHKWLFAPRGCGVLWTAPKWQDTTRPAVLSHGADQSYAAAFDWIGTRDPTPWLAFEAALLAHDHFGGNELMARNRALAALGARTLSGALPARAMAPESLRGAMAALVLEGCAPGEEAAAGFRRKLWDHCAITVPVYSFGGFLCVRISAQIYNMPSDYEALATACRNLLTG